MTTLQSQGPLLRYPEPIEVEIAHLTEVCAAIPALACYPLRWLAIQLLEGDEFLHAEVAALREHGLIARLQASMERLQAAYGDDLDVALVDQRYQFVHQLANLTLTRPATVPRTLSDQIDQIATNRWLGIPVFLAVMWLVFKLTTDIAAPLVDWIDAVINGPIQSWLLWAIHAVGLGGTWVESLLLGGVLAGVGGVLVFIPVLASLYLALAVLEDSGYMARAAFVMDRGMHALGLHGKSFLPMIVGFGCTVPAIYATRTLDNRRDRILTGLLVPFMSCSARLPVYVLIASVFFPTQAGMVIFGLYLLGIMVAILVGVGLRATLFRNHPPAPFVLELPPYRLPTPRTIWKQMTDRTAAFVRRAWTLILLTSLVVWLLLAIPVTGRGQFANAPVDESAFAALSGLVTPLFQPLGFGSWETTGALLTGVLAKEVVVSTLVQTFHIDQPGGAVALAAPDFAADLLQIGTGFVNALGDMLRALPALIGISTQTATAPDAAATGLALAIQASFEASSAGHGGLAAMAFLVFVLLYTPCIVATAAARHEFGQRWMWISVLGQFGLAWLAGVLIFQIGRLLGF